VTGTSDQPIRKRPGGRSARVRAAVLMAALDELAAGGYGSFSCEAVAERAGVHKTTVYRRWGTRENLMLDALLQAGNVSVPIPDTGSLLGDLVAYATAHAAVITAPAFEATVRAVAPTGDRDPALADASRRFWRARGELAAQMVERAIARGEVPPQTNPEMVIEMLTAPMYFRLLMSGEPINAEFVQAVAELVAAGARAGPGSPSATTKSPPKSGPPRPERS
jgi:AcrR family transcriptional regulator